MALKFKYSILQRFNFEALYNTFLGLQPREQIFALLGAGFVVLFIVGLPFSLASGKLGSLEKEITQGREKQRQILRELERYQQLKKELETVESKISGGFDATITTTMESLAEKSGIKDRLENIDCKEQEVKILNPKFEILNKFQFPNPNFSNHLKFEALKFGICLGFRY